MQRVTSAVTTLGARSLSVAAKAVKFSRFGNPAAVLKYVAVCRGCSRGLPAWSGPVPSPPKRFFFFVCFFPHRFLACDHTRAAPRLCAACAPCPLWSFIPFHLCLMWRCCSVAAPFARRMESTSVEDSLAANAVLVKMLAASISPTDLGQVGAARTHQRPHHVVLLAHPVLRPALAVSRRACWSVPPRYAALADV